jgi:hypothetical protein
LAVGSGNAAERASRRRARTAGEAPLDQVVEGEDALPAGEQQNKPSQDRVPSPR